MGAEGVDVDGGGIADWEEGAGEDWGCASFAGTPLARGLYSVVREGAGGLLVVDALFVRAVGGRFCCLELPSVHLTPVGSFALTESPTNETGSP